MSTGDARYIKSLNKRILIEKIIEHRVISRSELARITGLNKSTVSAQISEMLDERLVTEKVAELSNGGRKPILLQINEDAGIAAGIDIDKQFIQIHITNLLGKPIKAYRIPNDDNDERATINNLSCKLQEIVEEMNDRYAPFGLIGIGIGVHGIVNNEDRVIFTPKSNWVDVDLKNEIQSKFNVPVYVDNNADLSVYAEQVYNYPSPNLFNLTMYSGIGLGILQDNEIYRGFKGFAGEIGHMIVERGGLPCPCGNQGCWELYSSEGALKKELKAHGVIEDECEKIDVTSVFSQYPEIMKRYMDYFAVGMNNIINIFNPETIIINSPMLNENELLIQQLIDRLNSRMNYYETIVTSSLGRNACSLGGAMLALKNHYGVKTLNLNGYNYFEEVTV